ncbi:MAG: asparaginase [Oscillospiraceae bacterium]|jgi:L-asparaginase|nr:asparaginase [Oscillospiraceae bacterium]
MKKILWLQTGGTMDCKITADGLSPAPNVHITVETDGVSYVSERLFSLDSTALTPRHWQLMAKKVFEAAISGKYSGFVITHGTDTLQYSAAALSLMLENIVQPVVFTGAMIPLGADNSDAPANLSMAFAAARDLPGGVYVAFAGKIIDGSSCIKLHTKDKDSFTDAGLPFRTVSAVPVLRDKLCEKVLYLKITPVINNDISDFILEKGYRGMICEGYGLGGITDGFLEKLGALVKSGVRVVVVSQCVYGGTDLNVYAAHKRASDLGIEAWSMTGSAALVRLMIELGENLDRI